MYQTSKSRLGLIIGSIMLLVSGSTLAGPFIGIDYGPFHENGQMPGTPVTDAQFTSDLAVISGEFTFVKTYGDDAASRLDRIVPIAAAKFSGLKIYQGVSEDAAYNSSANRTFLDTAIGLANSYPQTVVAVVVGNECLDTDFNPNPISVTQLIADLQYVRSGLKDSKTQVTTGLGYAAAVKYGTQLAPYLDSVMVNIYPFYAPVPINDAMANLNTAYSMFHRQFSGKELIIGETGWPSAGAANGRAIPGVCNEDVYASEIIYTDQELASSNQLGSVFLFEAFDEPWLKAQNSWGPHWGLWDLNRRAKFSFSAGE